MGRFLARKIENWTHLKSFAFLGLLFILQLLVAGCTQNRYSLQDLNFFSSNSSLGSNGGAQTDAREVTFLSDMTQLGWMDVTQKGALVQTNQNPNTGCPDAVPNKSDAASVTQTTNAIQCRINYLQYGSNSGSLYFPAGTYYINQPLSFNNGNWVHNSDGSYAYVYTWMYQVHVMGENPGTTKIVWAGNCGTDPNIADPNKTTKYNDMIYVNGISPFSIERLTLDGQNCAGSGIDMVSKPKNMSGVLINEMNIQNLKEVGVVGDRPNLTNDEIRSGDTSGMVSEVTISRVTFAHIGYAGVMPNTYNALDYWIRDDMFDDCNIGATTSTGGTNNWVWNFPGLVQTPGLAWGDGGPGGFEISNSIFLNSRTADILSGGNAVRNSFSIASHGPFIQSAGTMVVQGNTVVASPGVVPIVTWGGTAGVNYGNLILLQNQFITQSNTPAVLQWTFEWGLTYPTSAYQGASTSVGNLWNETYGNVTSIGNTYTSTTPFSKASSSDLTQGVTLATAPGWAPTSVTGILQCGPFGGGLTSMLDGRTYCSATNLNFNPIYNLLTFDDKLGASVKTPSVPTLPPVRPEVKRNYIVPVLSLENTSEAGYQNSKAIQDGLNILATNQGKCASGDYSCADRWSVLFLPAGQYNISKTVDVPPSVQLQIVGSGSTFLRWYWYGTDNSGNPAGATPIFKLHAPAHVAMRDITLYGSGDPNFPNPLGEGIVAEVTDLTTSRVLTDQVNLSGSYTVNGIGNVPFEMRSFQNGGTGSYTGAGTGKPGYLAYFAGNPSNLTVGNGANLMIQDTWYEGPDSRYVTCNDGDQANITVESSMISMGGWHGVQADSKTSLNVSGCTTNTTVIGSTLGRSGFEGIAPTQSLLLPANATPNAHVLFLGNLSGNNSTYGNSEDIVPANYTGSLDQGSFLADPATPAPYANVMGSFFQRMVDNSNAADGATLSAKNTGTIQANFIRSTLTQAMDSRQSAPSRYINPITDTSSTDIRLEHIIIWGSRMDLQFVTPGGTAQ